MSTIDALAAGPGLVRTPFVILIDKAEKAPFDFHNIQARSYIDKEQRIYIPRTERRYLGVGMGDYSLDGFQDQVAIERKSMEDFQGTLLGWPQEIDPDDPAETTSRREIDRRGRFKVELRRLQALQAKAVVIEAPLFTCLESCPQWGTRTAAENGKYLYATFLAWSQEFAVPWIFCDDKDTAALTTFRILEQFYDRNRRHFRKLERDRAKAAAQAVLQPLLP